MNGRPIISMYLTHNECLRVAPVCALTVPPVVSTRANRTWTPLQAYHKKSPLTVLPPLKAYYEKSPLAFLCSPKSIADSTPQLRAMNNPESNNTYKPKQALAPTPQLYDELSGDGMETLAEATVAEILPIPSGSIILDDGCGTGCGTAAIVAKVRDASGLTIKGVDINEDALALYKQKAAENNWPAEAIKEDAQALSIPDSTFTHAIGTAFVFVLPDEGIPAIKEIYRTLKPGGVAALNTWAYVPNIAPIQAASRYTRPEGTPLPRAGMEFWQEPGHLQRIVEEGGFCKENITVTKRDVYVITTGIDRYATMLWSFIGGTTTAGWLESDEIKWDEAIEIVKKELSETDGYKELDGGRIQLKFVANIAVATK